MRSGLVWVGLRGLTYSCTNEHRTRTPCPVDARSRAAAAKRRSTARGLMRSRDASAGRCARGAEEAVWAPYLGGVGWGGVGPVARAAAAAAHGVAAASHVAASSLAAAAAAASRAPRSRRSSRQRTRSPPWCTSSPSPSARTRARWPSTPAPPRRPPEAPPRRTGRPGPPSRCARRRTRSPATTRRARRTGRCAPRCRPRPGRTCATGLPAPTEAAAACARRRGCGWGEPWLAVVLVLLSVLLVHGRNRGALRAPRRGL